jgi:hypothetical protein
MAEMKKGVRLIAPLHPTHRDTAGDLALEDGLGQAGVGRLSSRAALVSLGTRPSGGVPVVVLPAGGWSTVGAYVHGSAILANPHFLDAPVQ